jgi:tRNA (cmo5U34)-methyltransferase
MTDKERKMEEIRANFTQGSDGYDDRIRKIIPRYGEMLEALMSCIPSEGRRLRAIDIGCGTGAVSELLFRSHPEVDLTCLDMTESMLDRARDRLKAHDNIKFVLADIYDFELDGPYDLVISSLALHHVISDRDKKAIYRKIFDALSPGGWFPTLTSSSARPMTSRRSIWQSGRSSCTRASRGRRSTMSAFPGTIVRTVLQGSSITCAG